MGIIKELVLLPVAPVRFTVWVMDKVAEDVDRTMNSPQARIARLRDIDERRQRGELDEEQAAELEAQVIEEATTPAPIDAREGGENG